MAAERGPWAASCMFPLLAHLCIPTRLWTGVWLCHACLQACRESSVSLSDAERQVLEFVQQHAPEPSTAQARAARRCRNCLHWPVPVPHFFR